MSVNNWYQEDRDIKPPEMVQIHYKVLEKMGEGGCGAVFLGKSLLNYAPVAIKFQSKREVYGVDLLKNEYYNYRKLSGKKGIPLCYTWGKVDDDLSCLVLELLGETVHDRFSKNPKFGMKDVRDIAIQMLSRLETIHGEGLLWLDVKPQNMAYGRKATRAQDTLYSLDFGFMVPYIVNGRHIRQKITGDKFGTLRYMSRNMHRGKTPSRRDDMESLCYVLVYLAKRRLPWQGKVEDDGERAVYDLKKNIDPAKLCAGLPDAFYKFCKYVLALKFTDEPKYELCRSFFTDMDRFEWSDSDDESSSSINQKPLSNDPTPKCNIGSATDKKPSTKVNTSPTEECVSNKVSPKDSSPVLQAKTDMNSSKKEHILPTKECAITNPTPEDSSPVPQAKMDLNSSKKEQISPTNECIKSNTSPEDSSPIPLADMDIKLSNKEGILLTKECTSDKVITDNSSPVPPAVTPTMPESQQTSDTNNGPSSTTDMHMSSVALRIEKLKLLTDDVKARVGPSIEDPLFFALLVEIERLYSDTKKHKIKGRDHKEVAADSQQTANSTEQATKDSSNVDNHERESLQVTPDGCRDKSKEKSRNNVSTQTDSHQVTGTNRNSQEGALPPSVKEAETKQSIKLENREFENAPTEIVDKDTNTRLVSRLARFVRTRKIWKKASAKDVTAQQIARTESSCVLDCNTITEACEIGTTQQQGIEPHQLKKAKKCGAPTRAKLFISTKILRRKQTK